MYAKVFRSLWDGTLGPDWPSWGVFVFMLAHSDLEGFVDMTPQAIAARSGIPLDQVKQAIAKLESPDPDSRSQEQEGRRLERIDAHRTWGWRIVNYQHYRGLRDEETVRAQTRARVQKHRLTHGNALVAEGNAQKRHAEVDVDVDVDADVEAAPTGLKSKQSRAVARFVPPTHEQVRDLEAQLRSQGRHPVSPERFIDFYESKGWMVGRSRMKSWPAAYRRSESWDHNGHANGNGKMNARQLMEAAQRMKAAEVSRG